ncbi:MAG: PQQ-dependent sugar dehydrogenase, partial [Nitrososphaerales archaeon]
LRWLIASEQKDGVGVGRFAIVQIGDGAADANGEARGSFVVGENISGPFTFELKLLSDADGFGEVSIDLIPRGTILNPLPYTLDIRTETVIDGLGECGTSFVFVPDGRIFCTELKSGKVRVIENFQLLPEPLIQLEVYHTSDFPPDERGLTGITIDPEFEKNHYVYLHWTYWDSEDNEQYNRVARFTESNNKLNDMKILLGKIPAAAHHNGGPLEFGYDGKLYVTGGDAQGLFSPAGEQAQNMNTSAGKIFRINSDGTIPEDNPFPGLPYYTLGHRNVFGIGFHPETGIAYVTENGPECCDELNKLTPSKNYGWPYFAGRERWYMNVAEDFLIGKEYHGPLMQFFSIIAPTELTFYSGDRYIGENNNMFFLSFMHTQLYRVILKPPNYDEVESASVYSISLESDKEGIFDSLFDIEQGPDGYLYVSSFRSIMRLDFIYSDLPTTILLESKSAVKTGETVGLKAAISDYFGNPVAGLPIEFFDSDKLIGSAISNQDGIAEIEYSLEGMGQHIITAKYAGGEKYLESSSAERILPI